MNWRSRGIKMERENVGVTATRSFRLPGAAAELGNFCRLDRPSRTWARYSLPSVVSEKSARPNSLVPMICSSWRTRWLTALGVTHVELLTNNPLKVAGLAGHGLAMTRVSHAMPPNPHNSAYLDTKRDRQGHLL